METKHTRESLGTITVVGLRAMFKVAPNPFRIWSIIVSIFLTIIFLVIFYLLHGDSYMFIKELTTQAIAFIPNILGFTIGGYAFLIGVNSSTLLNKITEPQSHSKYSLYQEASASFAINLVIQACTFVISYCVHFIILLEEGSKISNNLSECTTAVVNHTILSILCLLFISSLFMIIQIIVNIFDFSQLIHYGINRDKLDGMGNTDNNDKTI
jgi:hypothetical protein